MIQDRLLCFFFLFDLAEILNCCGHKIRPVNPPEIHLIDKPWNI